MAGIFPGWKVVAGAGIGVAFCSSVFIGSSFSLLSAAIGAQFGWSQTQLALGASLVLLAQVFTYPAAGALADRIGSRWAALVAIMLFSGCLVLLAQVGTGLWPVPDEPLMQYYAAFLLIGLLAAGTNMVSYTRALTHWFDRHRGMAIGLAAAFQAVGATVMPIAFQKIIVLAGWPTAVLALAGFLVVVCLPFVGLLVKDSPEPLGLHPDGAPEPPVRPADAALAVSPGLRQLLADPVFRRLALSFAVMGCASYALTTNAVYILTSTAGLTLAQVATVQAISGASVLIGRIGFGFLLDRLGGSLVAILATLLGASVFISYGMGGSYSTIVLTAVVAGIAIGGESDLMPYLAGRYFGKEAVSGVFGWFLSAFVVGAALGPVGFAQLAAWLGGPAPALFSVAALHVVPVVLLLGLRRPQDGLLPGGRKSG